MVVLEPLKVTIKNPPQTHPIDINVPDFPNDLDKGSHNVKFDKVIYIERSDFREVRDYLFDL